MPRAFTPKEIKEIVGIIRDWPIGQKLTWDAICKAAESVLDFVPTRQAFVDKPAVTNAYKIRKAAIASHRDRLASVPMPKSLAAAAETIARQQEQINQLKQEIQGLADMARRFIHNGVLHGLKREQLNAPLPKFNHKK
ncbi:MULTISPECIES: hypothetical protein [Pseudomonas]|uniref:hypothetical protein n=1 Tax=Pseudomonas TaxID=286 RepID=UPI000811D43E|nr:MULTISPECIES: hypothetical protein [Pseudomonas]RRW54624.1 hypothetical protein EGJ55_15350 [Pseudomonas moraviensis]CRM69999.1 hypothetical protein [Pseudomonas sp. 25 E 4]